MDFASWGIPNNFSATSWGVTPMSLAAPFALLIVILMSRRITQTTGPKMEKRDVGGAALITVIIGAAFLWIFAGLGMLGRIVH